MLDVMIRDASDNRQSLDGVMRTLYRSTCKAGRGFTGADWWRAVSTAAGGKSFTDFAARYVDGREPYPWGQILPLAGLRIVSDTILRAAARHRLGAGLGRRVVVRQVHAGERGARRPASRAATSCCRLGDIAMTDPDFGPKFRSEFGKEEGQPLPIQVRARRTALTLTGKVRLVPRVESRLEVDPARRAKAVRVREGIFKGTTGT